MDFDPLSLFTPELKVEDEVVVTGVYQNDLLQFQSEENGSHWNILDEDDSHLVPLHILDLPMLQLKPTFDALMVFLKLLSPNDTYNFNQQELLSQVDIEQVFVDKQICNNLLQTSLEWYRQYCPRFDTEKKLAYIPYLSSCLKQLESEYNGYMTRIISSNLSWIENPDAVRKQASLRLSENCGRTAQPEIIRKISLPNLEHYLGDTYIKLKEPSLTNDNLGFKTWGSSLILSQRLLLRSNYLHGTVLELGSGTGLVGMICALLGFKTYLTDLPEIVPNLLENIKINRIQATVSELDWCNPNSFMEKFGDLNFETIVVSDPIYSSNHPQWVVNMINQFIKSNGKVLIQIPLRPKFEAERADLWSLMLVNFKELEHEIEDGFDDFGELKFCFKVFQRI